MMSESRPVRPHAGTPRVISGVTVGTPVELRIAHVDAFPVVIGVHAGEPALV
jgi:hypothetical protein